MPKQMRVGVKVAWITGILTLTGIIFTVIFSRNSASDELSIQKVDDQKVDSGAINNYNAEGDINISYDKESDTRIKNDSLTNSQKIIVYKEKATSKPIKDSAVIINAKNVNTGTNNGIIGDNNVITEPVQPHPDSIHVTGFIKLFPDRSTKASFAYMTDNKSSRIFTYELVELLKNNGYSNLGIGNYLMHSGVQNFKKNTIRRTKDSPDGTMNFFVNY